MARIEPLPKKRAGLFVRLAYWMATRRLGKVPVPIGIMAHSRWILAATAAYELSLERAHRVDGRIKELATIRTAMMIGCRFCVDIGVALASKYGVTEQEIRDLADPEASPRFTEHDKRVIRYAEAMSGCPMVVPDGLFATLLDELGREAMVELTAAIAWENHRARFNHAFGAIEEGYSDRSECILPPRQDLLEERHAG
jgi:AhpD family alkylhydroperoxidase